MTRPPCTVGIPGRGLNDRDMPALAIGPAAPQSRKIVALTWEQSLTVVDALIRIARHRGDDGHDAFAALATVFGVERATALVERPRAKVAA